MKKVLKKSISVLVIAVIVFGVALTASIISGSDFVGSKAKAYTETGTFEGNIKWSYNHTSCVLTLSGNGAISSCDHWLDYPWMSYQSRAKEIIIEDGITSIPNLGFYKFSGLTTVTLPKTLTKTLYSVFHLCDKITTTYYSGTYEQWQKLKINTNNGTLKDNIILDCNSDNPYYIPGQCGDNISFTLYTNGDLILSGSGKMTSSPVTQEHISKHISIIKKVVVGENITSIYGGAFQNCVNLSNITLSEGITSIGGLAFGGCKTLRNVTLPKSLKSIYVSAFKDCYNIENVWYNGNMSDWCSLEFDDVASNPVRSATNVYFEGTLVSGEYSIPDGVTAIGNYTFTNFRGIASLVLPESVTRIGKYAFSSSGIKAISLTEKIKSVDEYAFSSGINIIYYPGTYEQWEYVSVAEHNSVLENRLLLDCNSERPYYMPGTCGENLTWTFYADGEIVIDGTGQMNNYDSLNHSPWIVRCEKMSIPYTIRAITINEGVTSIGNYAFECIGIKIYGNYYDVYHVEKISIADSVKTIGNYAFNKHRAEDISLGNGIESIGDAAFQGAYITDLVIPDSVKSIGKYAFNCYYLKKVTFGNGLTSLSAYAFFAENDTVYGARYIEFSEITMPLSDYLLNYFDDLMTPGYSWYGEWDSLEKITFTDGNGIIPDNYNGFEGAQKTLKELVFEGNVAGIGNSAFSDFKALETVSVTEGVNSIGDEAFFGCSNLKSITIPEGIENLGESVFRCCTSLKNVTIGSGITAVPSYAFGNCTALEDVQLPESVKIIEQYAFYNCEKLAEISLPEGLETIALSAFGNCISLEEITLVDSLEHVAPYAFYGCADLKKVNYNSTNGKDYEYHHYDSDFEGVFEDCVNLSVVNFGEKVQRIPAGMFKGLSKISTVEIPETVTEIGAGAFKDCVGIKELTMPISVSFHSKSSYNPPAFLGCVNIEKITLTKGDGSQTRFVGERTPWGISENLEHLIISDGVSNFEWNIFEGCHATNIYIPESINSFIYYFGGYYDNVRYRGTLKNWLKCNFNEGCNPMVYGANLYVETDKLVENFVVPADIYSISAYAFDGCESLKSVTMHDETDIGWGAFRNCKNLEKVVLPKSNYGYIPGYAFSGCSALESVDLSGCGSIADEAFSYCYNLKNVIFPKKGHWIGNKAFQYCTSLESVENDSVVEISTHAFYGCSSIKSVSFSECLTVIDYYAFYRCGLPDDLIVPENVEYIGHHAFASCSGLKTVTVNSSRINIGEYAFADNPDLETVYFNPVDCTSLNSTTFENCRNLRTVVFGDDVQSIPAYAFANLESLEKVYCPNNLTKVERNTFDGSDNVVIYCNKGSYMHSYAMINSMKYVLLDDGNEPFMIRNGVLIDYLGESSAVILPAVDAIGFEAFANDLNIKSVEIDINTAEIHGGAFRNCTSLNKIIIPYSVTSIATDAFEGCDNVVIYCYNNSTSHKYAIENNIDYVLIKIVLSESDITLLRNETANINANINVNMNAKQEIIWESSNTSAVMVNNKGKITAVGAGESVITAKIKNTEVKATCTVKALSPIITIHNPSTRTISYKSGIILHATATDLPDGAKIVWEKDNGNFTMSDDGNGNCTIVSAANGDSIFTAKIRLANGVTLRDSSGNEYSAQIKMSSKAGFFDKIIAFFRGLFGGNKIVSQMFKGIY